MSSIPFDHTYLFSPGRWNGSGKLSIAGGSTEPIKLHLIISHSGSGTITAHMEVNFDEAAIGGGVELVYTIDLEENGSFSFIQYNSQLGTLTGKGSATESSILLSYQSEDGAYGGKETVFRHDDDNYSLRGTLSLNGIPSSLLQAQFTRLANIEE
jgi:hypothetical protein